MSFIFGRPRGRTPRQPFARAALARVIGVLFCALACGSSAETEPHLRSLQVDDVLAMENVGIYFGGAYQFSPDDRSLVLVRQRSMQDGANLGWESPSGNERADLWLQEAPGGTAVNLTRGSSDEAGFFAPQWSPDGQNLAFVSTRGGQARLWVWEKATRELRLLSKRNVDVVGGLDQDLRLFEWVSSSRIIFAALPDTPTAADAGGHALAVSVSRFANQWWSKMESGKQVTASVLSTLPQPSEHSAESGGQLLLLDIGDGSVHVVADGKTSLFNLSPDKTKVAFFRALRQLNASDASGSLRSVAETYTLEVRRLDGTLLFDGAGIPPNLPAHFSDQQWSPDGSELAFLGYRDTGGREARLYRFDTATRRCATVDLQELYPDLPLGTWAPPGTPNMQWTGQGDLLLRVSKEWRNKNHSSRLDWWLFTRRGGPPRNMTGAMETPPWALWPQSGRERFFGVAAGKIWRLDLPQGRIEDLTKDFAEPIKGIVYPALSASLPEFSSTAYSEQDIRPAESVSQVLFITRGHAPYLLDLPTRAITALRKPERDASLVAFSARSGSLIYFRATAEGTRVSRHYLDSDRVDILMEANSHLREIAEGEFRSLDYTSLNGERLKAWIILPVGYQAGKHYPLITWVYPGVINGDEPAKRDRMLSTYSKQIPPARGYAVLIPSMPPKIGASEMSDFPNGVLPAVEKAVELGFADPDRLFLLGHSNGGYATFALVTQTNRFKAAVSLAGYGDLISFWGTPPMGARYQDNNVTPGYHFGMVMSEGWSNFRIERAPWDDVGHYIRNSPLFYADRVNTPLLIIKGDMDYVPLEQGEEIFLALHRQDKTVELVRYWGEGHVFSSPANIRDMWARIFKWFDDFGDISRAANGELAWAGDHVKSRKEAAAK